MPAGWSWQGTRSWSLQARGCDAAGNKRINVVVRTVLVTWMRAARLGSGAAYRSSLRDNCMHAQPDCVALNHTIECEGVHVIIIDKTSKVLLLRHAVVASHPSSPQNDCSCPCEAQLRRCALALPHNSSSITPQVP